MQLDTRTEGYRLTFRKTLNAARSISFRYASEKESEAYYGWISQEAD
jgi:uncharacterized DUF497 family protein